MERKIAARLTIQNDVGTSQPREKRDLVGGHGGCEGVLQDCGCTISTEALCFFVSPAASSSGSSASGTCVFLPC